MKSSFLFPSIFLFILFLCTPCLAAENDEISLAWDHPGATDLKQFELRINEDDSTILVIPSELREWTGNFTLNDDDNIFNVRACDLAGQCSDWSEPCEYNPVPAVPILKCKTIVINVYCGD